MASKHTKKARKKNTTPAKTILGADREKTRASMKKLKKFIRSHSKRKSGLSQSPSMAKVKLSLNGVEKTLPSSCKTGSVAGTLLTSPSLKSAKSAAISTVQQLKLGCKAGRKETTASSKINKRRSLSSNGASLQPASSEMTNSNCEIYVNKLPSRPLPLPVTGLIPSRSEYCEHSDPSELFCAMIEPVTTSKFFKDIWEKKPLLVRRHSPRHNDGWFSTSELDRILREEVVNFSDNIDVVTYLNGKRETHNPTGRAYAPVVWDFYQNGCSVRMLNPHTYARNVWSRLSLLQQYFGCVAGANIYLTPPGSQGFAPHWDDIEAFVLQLEGRKHWRVYEPRTESEVLPRFSSGNFTDADLPADPVVDAVLEPGDLLYFPRGYIHQGYTMDESHSLHITVSVGQKNTWGDFLMKMLPRAVEIAMDEDVEFRKSLPRECFNVMGVAFSNDVVRCVVPTRLLGPNRENSDRTRFLKSVESLVSKLMTHAPVDAAVDQMAKEFLQNSLPPALTPAECERSVHGTGERWDSVENRVRCAVELEPDTQVRIIRHGILRLVAEEDKVFVYHNLENSRMLHSSDLQCIEIDPAMAEAVEFLIHRHPDFVAVDDLPMDTVQDRVALAASLYDRGLLMTREPMESLSDNDDDDDDDDDELSCDVSSLDSASDS